MAKLYRDFTGKEEIRPSSDEVVRRIHRRMNGRKVVQRMTESEMENTARIQANRQRMREKMAPIVLGIINEIDAWRGGDLCIGRYVNTALLRLDEIDRTYMKTMEGKTLEALMRDIRMRIAAPCLFFIDSWIMDMLESKNPEYIDTVLLAVERKKSGLTMSSDEPKQLPSEILSAGFLTGVAYEVNAATAIIQKYKEQFGNGITAEKFQEVFRNLPVLTEILTRTQMNVFLAIENGLLVKRGHKRTDHIYSDPFYNTQRLWLAEDTETHQMSLELDKKVVTRCPVKLGLDPVNCSARSRGVHWLHDRTTEILEAFVIPNLDEINASLS